jgi:hypothetical protein
MPEQYLYLKLRELANKPVEHKGMPALLRQYLYEKYSHKEPLLEAAEK